MRHPIHKQNMSSFRTVLYSLDTANNQESRVRCHKHFYLKGLNKSDKAIALNKNWRNFEEQLCSYVELDDGDLITSVL